MRITKVYTKTGDKGKTRLAGGQLVWKNSLRVEAYGTIDELNASLGVARALCLSEATDAVPPQVERELRCIQNKLFDIGGLLATKPGQSFPNMPSVAVSDVMWLEHAINEWQKDLKPLKEFVLPGGGTIAASLHFSRTICRRAERRCVSLMQKEAVNQVIITYLNRLSDVLFVLARWVAHQRGEKETLWERTNPTTSPT